MSMADKMVMLGYGFPSYFAVALILIAIPLTAVALSKAYYIFYFAHLQASTKKKLMVYFDLALLLSSSIFGLYQIFVLLTL